MRCLILILEGLKLLPPLLRITKYHNATKLPPTRNTGIAMCNTLACLVQQYQGQFDYIAVASTGIINQGRLTALNPKNLGVFS